MALPIGEAPDGEALGAGLLACGALADSEEVGFRPGWRSPDALPDLSYAGVRRALQDLVGGREPRDLPPGDTDDLVRRWFGVLVGLRIDWDIPVREEILAAGCLPEAPDADVEPTAAEADRAACFDRWRGQVFQQSQGCVPLAVAAFSEVANEIADFLADAGEQTGGLEDIRAFVAEGRRKAGGDEIVCHTETVGGDLTLTLHRESGQFLDSVTFPARRLPVEAERMQPLVAAFVRMAQDKP